jgi:hypothetical protein
MNYKKTFWMNVIFAITWVLLCLLSFAIDIDYEDYTLIKKLLTALMQLFIFSTSIITANHLYKSNNSLVSKIALFSNYSCVITTILILLFIAYLQQPIISFEFLVIIFIYCVFMIPFLLNIKVIKAIQLYKL